MIDIDLLLTYGASYKKVATGETIFTEGNTCNFYYQSITGNIKWINIDESGKEFVQYYIQAGDCFGELPLFDDQPYAASAIAENDCVIIRLHKPVFLELLADHPEFYKTFACLLASRIRFKMFVLKELVHQTPEHRITSMIEYFKSSHTNICQKCNQLKLTRQQLADITGLRVETVIRTMRVMHDKGQLVITKGKVFF